MALGNDERGVADVLAMAVMFILVILAGTTLHLLNLQPLEAATDRQLALKSEHLYKTLGLAYIDPYSISYLKAASENLVLAQPMVPSYYLRSSMENALSYLKPDGYAVRVVLTYENNTWQLQVPTDASRPVQMFKYEGTISLIKAEAGEERSVIVRASVELWKVS